jgi:hypothetical protein
MNQLNRSRLHRLLALAAVFAVAVAAAQTAPTTTTSPATKPAWYIVDASKSYNDPTARVHGPLVDGETIYQADLPARANVEYVPATTQKIGSLSTSDNGVRRQGSPVEGQQPWSIGGDDSHGKWNAIPIEVGQHKYLAQAFAGWNAGAVIESNAVTINVATTKPTPDTKPTSQPATQPGVTGTIKIPPPPFPTITRVDTTTLATAVWNGRTSFVGDARHELRRAARLGVRTTTVDFDMQHHRRGHHVHQHVRTTSSLNYRAVVARVHDAKRARRAGPAGGSPRASRASAASNQTFRNLVDLRRLGRLGRPTATVRATSRSITSGRSGRTAATGSTTGGAGPADVRARRLAMLRNVYVHRPHRAERRAVARPDGLYNLEGLLRRRLRLPESATLPDGTVGAGLRFHNTDGGWITFERCIDRRLREPHRPAACCTRTTRASSEGLTFRDCVLKNRWHVTNGTSGLLFDRVRLRRRDRAPAVGDGPGRVLRRPDRSGHRPGQRPLRRRRNRHAGRGRRSGFVDVQDADDHAQRRVHRRGRPLAESRSRAAAASTRRKRYDGPVRFDVP